MPSTIFCPASDPISPTTTFHSAGGLIVNVESFCVVWMTDSAVLTAESTFESVFPAASMVAAALWSESAPGELGPGGNRVPQLRQTFAFTLWALPHCEQNFFVGSISSSPLFYPLVRSVNHFFKPILTMRSPLPSLALSIS